MIEAQREAAARRINEAERAEGVRHDRASVRGPRVGRDELDQRANEWRTGDAVVDRATHLGESHSRESHLSTRRRRLCPYDKGRHQKHAEEQEAKRSHAIVG